MSKRGVVRHAERHTAMPNYYHLTNDPDFKLNPDFVPDSPHGEPGIYMTPESQLNRFRTDYGWDRPHTTQIHVPDDLDQSHHIEKDYDSDSYDPDEDPYQVFVPAEHFNKLEVRGTHPTEGYDPKNSPEFRKKSGILRQREIDAIFRESDMAAVIGGAEPPDHDYLQHALGGGEDWGIARTAAAPTAPKPQMQPAQPIDMAKQNMVFDKPAPGSSHGAEIHKDATGSPWLVKKAPPGKDHLVDMDVAANRIATHSGLEAPATFKMNTPEGGTASAQLMYPGAKDAFPGKFDPESLSDDDMLTVQKHHALDWMLGNHDDHKQNFIRTQDGKLVGIDKGQAMKFVNNDRLHWDFFPNEHEPVHNTMYRNMAQGGRLVHDPRQGELGQYIQGLQDIPDEDYQQMLQPYAEGAAAKGELAKDYKAAGYSPHHGGDLVMGDARMKPNDVAMYLEAATQRKNTLMNDFGKLHDRAMTHHKTGTGIA